MSEKNTQVVPEIGRDKYKGHTLFTIRPKGSDRKPMKFGLQKAKLILAAEHEIKAYVAAVEAEKAAKEEAEAAANEQDKEATADHPQESEG